MASAHHCDCGARIILAATAARRQALDWVPDPQGTAAAYRDALGTWRVRILEPGEEPLHPERRDQLHVASCPRRPPPGIPAAGIAFLAQDKRVRSERAQEKRNKSGRRTQPPNTGLRTYSRRQQCT